MDTASDVRLHRTSSQTSATSSRRSSTVRIKPRKYASNASLNPVTTPSDKSLTSFPSLAPSPDASPVHSLQTPRSFPASSVPRTPSPPTVRKTQRPTQQSIVGKLTLASPSGDDRTALFDDAPLDARDAPGTLHQASDEHIERQLARVGPVALVRQLAEDLAQRDAQMTVLRRRAEERERILKKMLREVEVSNWDIENRLKMMDQRKVSGPNGAGIEENAMHPRDDLSKRLSQALSDLQPEDLEDTSGFALGDTQDLEATIRGSKGTNSAPSIADDASSLASNDEPRAAKPDWKTYLWGRGGSKAPSIASKDDNDSHSQTQPAPSTKRKALNSDLFLPPAQGTETSGSDQEVGDHNTHSRRSSTSVSSWAMKLVAGSKRSGRDSTPSGTRAVPRRGNSGSERDAPTDVTSQRKYSTVKGNTASAPRDDTAKLRSNLRNMLDSSGTNTRKSQPETSRGFSNLLSSADGAQETIPRRSSNLGPVEMDMILPDETRPPALMQNYNPLAEGEYLTDPFGFIYDQRRKKRQSEAAAALRNVKRSSNVESLSGARGVMKEASRSINDGVVDPATVENNGPHSPRTDSPAPTIEQGETQGFSSWQDFLKLATFQTELLAHTPSAAPITAVESAEDEPTPKVSQVLVQKQGSLPAVSVNPEPSPSRIVSGHAEFSQVSPASPSTPDAVKGQDPVKALLDQLTELHESVQKDKTVKWNEFLRKVRAERKREGEAAAGIEGRSSRNAMPEATLADGEIIGVAGLGIKGKVGRAKWNDFRSLVLTGIPVAFRAKIWAECSGASALRLPGYYDDLVREGTDSIDPQVVVQIQMDITRTLTDNVFFRSGPGVPKLREMLTAYARRNQDVGYCQGMNLIAASLLLVLPTAEDAFWILASMIENILPSSYYDHSLLTSRADQQVLRSYVTELLPRLSAHLDELSIELEALTFQWFLSVFTDCLSAEALFRVWDVLLCMHDGSTFLFQVALALLKLNERALVEECPTPAEVYHYINHQMTNHAISIDGLIRASDALKKVIRRPDVEARRAIAVEREQEVMRQREELRQQRVEERRKSKAAASAAKEELVKDAGLKPLQQVMSDSASDASKVSQTSDESEARVLPTKRSTSFRLAEERERERENGEQISPEEMRMTTPMEEEAGWMT